MERPKKTPKALTENQMKSLHPAVRAEFRAGRLNDEQARTANRLIRRPYEFKSRIALRAALENVGKAGLAALADILRAMPADAPAQLLETASFDVLRKKRPLDEAVREVEEAADQFRGKREAQARRPKPPRREKIEEPGDPEL